MLDEQGNHIAGHNQMELHGKQCCGEDGEAGEDSDSDFNSDGDEEVLRTLRHQRLAALKEAHE